MASLIGFDRPDLATLVEEARAILMAYTVDGDAVLRRDVALAIATALAAGLDGLHGHLDWSALQGHPLYATDWLEPWGRVWGVSRKEASVASGAVTLTGTAGATIPAGAVLSATSGAVYTVTTGVSIGAGGTVTATVAAATPGAAGNLDAGAPLSLTEPAAGVAATATVGAEGLGGGADQEDLESYRLRILARIQKPPHGGAAHDYEAWALSVEGVTRVWVTPGAMGLGTVSVRVAMDAIRENGIPTEADLEAVRAVMAENRPVTADVYVPALVAGPVDVTIRGLTPDTPEVRARVAENLRGMLLREGGPTGGMLRLSWFWNAVSQASGEDAHDIVEPAASLALPVGHLPILGTLTFEDAP